MTKERGQARSVARMFLRGSRELKCHCVAQSRCQIITGNGILKTTNSCNRRQIHEHIHFSFRLVVTVTLTPIFNNFFNAHLEVYVFNQYLIKLSTA